VTILVIKLGALGDFIQATGPFAAIRRRHAGERIVLLTTTPFAALARESGFFDEVWVDERPPWWNLPAVMQLRRRLREGGFTFVYDLQTSDRSSWYFRLMGRAVRWSGIAPGCSHPHDNPVRDAMHTVDRQREQLAMAGIEDVPPPDVSWLKADTARFALPARYALLVPGGAAHRLRKRWPAGRYALLVRELIGRGITPVLIGGPAEAKAMQTIRATVPDARDLSGQTSLAEIAALARGAVWAAGNDTGPMHVIVAAGCPSVVLFSDESDPALCAPREGQGGPRPTIVRRASLEDVAVSEVVARLKTMGASAP
jgi:ADP-heptose:LPS heptosyltransferase